MLHTAPPADRPLSCMRTAAVLALALLLVPASAVFAGGGDRLIVDPLNGFSLLLPEGWTATTPDPSALGGSTTLSNYDPRTLEHSSLGQENVFEPGLIKIGLSRSTRPEHESFGSWAAEHVSALQAKSRLPDYESGDVMVSDARPVRIAGWAGSAFTLSGPAISPILQIDLDWGVGKSLTARVTPATSEALTEALAVLEGLSRELEPARTNLLTTRTRVLALDPVIAELVGGINHTQEKITAAVASCRSGTFPGGEAPDGGNEITLNLPFEYQASYYWEAGEIGSYFGNGAHCNGNNDYYAIDWNRYSDSNCTSDAGDYGQAVLAMAAGEVSNVVAEADDTTGYGNHVEIIHTVGSTRYRTRYGHLSSYSVSETQNVTQGQQIGAVGSTGNSSGDHLHQSFQKEVNGTFYSHCYNNGNTCPNDEDPLWPQSPKPSPLQTASGSTAIVDGGCYQGPNGGGGGFNETVDDSDPACGLYGNAAWWHSVSGYGINNQMHYTYNNQSGVDNYVYWNLSIPSSGNYTFQVFIPRNYATTTSAQYAVYDGSSWHWYSVNQNIHYDDWVTLGTLYVTAGTRFVYLQDATGEAAGTRLVGVDAVRAIQ